MEEISFHDLGLYFTIFLNLFFVHINSYFKYKHFYQIHGWGAGSYRCYLQEAPDFQLLLKFHLAVWRKQLYSNFSY